jgi:hypothetical protein
MKTYTKPLAIGLILLSLTAAGPVLAEEGPAPGGFAAEHGDPWGANRNTSSRSAWHSCTRN